MRSKYFIAISMLLLTTALTLHAAPCPFDAAQTCTIQRDILNDIGPNGLKYYASTNYDHRISGEIEVYDASLVKSYTDNVNKPGQLKLLAQLNNGKWRAGEIMTRVNLNLPPYNSPVKSNPWTTKEIQHGYLEVIVKMPKCDVSTDGTCQANSQANFYQAGLWPAIWMEPTMDANWPQNGEIDISEAYLQGTDYQTSTATFHFNGNSPRCHGGDCVFQGFGLNNAHSNTSLWKEFHIWGFEWQPDPASKNGGKIVTGYFDNVRIWGPIATDSLPADGPGALSRGFNDPNGGYYLIVNLALGGGYAGNPNPQMQASSMYIQSAKAYTVGGDGPPVKQCLPPANIAATWTANKKSITLNWQQPGNSDTITSYQVNDWQNKKMWSGTTLNFTDMSLPGTNGTFAYFLYSNCPSGQSTGVQKNVIINGPPPANQCLPPTNIKGVLNANKKWATLSWNPPTNSESILNYQVSTCENRVLWMGTDLQYVDKTLPGNKGTYSYILYSNCANGLSSGAPFSIDAVNK